jgi:pimeloyl-ACP methyl ester carboxylesterase
MDTGGDLIESFTLIGADGRPGAVRYTDLAPSSAHRAPGAPGGAGAPPILFTHGLGCASTMDYAQVATLEPLVSRRRLLVDLMGFGASARPVGWDYRIRAQGALLAALLDGLGVERVVLYGHSMGGAVALELARLGAGRIAGVILAEPNLDPGGGSASREIASQDPRAFEERGFAQMVAALRKEVNPWARTLRLASPEALHGAATSLVEGSDPSWRDILYSLDCPRFQLFGATSPPDPDFEELPRHGIGTLMVPQTGHNMAWENPRAVAEGIGRCLAAMG